MLTHHDERKHIAIGHSGDLKTSMYLVIYIHNVCDIINRNDDISTFLEFQQKKKKIIMIKK